MKSRVTHACQSFPKTHGNEICAQPSAFLETIKKVIRLKPFDIHFPVDQIRKRSNVKERSCIGHTKTFNLLVFICTRILVIISSNMPVRFRWSDDAFHKGLHKSV